MALQLSTAVRNARLDAVETVAGSSAVLRVRSGAQPADCAAADTGTVLATITLPADWMSAAANGSKALSGTWQDASADATGVAGHFRIYDGATCHIQGSVGTSAADMIVDNVNFAAGQTFNVNSFTITDGNA